MPIQVAYEHLGKDMSALFLFLIPGTIIINPNIIESSTTALDTDSESCCKDEQFGSFSKY